MTEEDRSRPEPAATEIVSLAKQKPVQEPAVTEMTPVPAPTETDLPIPAVTATEVTEVTAAAAEPTVVVAASTETTAAGSTADAAAEEPASEAAAEPTDAAAEPAPEATADSGAAEAAPAEAATVTVEVPPAATVEIQAPAAAAPIAAPAAAQQPHPPHPPQQAWPQQQAWPPPAAAQPGPWQPPAPPPGPQRKFPMWIPITIASVVGLAIIGGIAAIIWSAVAPKPVDMANQAVTGASQWGGATYRGTVDGVRGNTTYEVSVTGVGLRGTLTRPGGAKAEVVKDNQGTLIRANKQWWQPRYSEDAAKLADVWLGDAAAELSDVDQILKTEPRALAKITNIDPSGVSLWRQTGERDVDGVRVLELTDVLHRIWITADSPHRLVAIDIVYTRSDGEPTRVAELDAALIEQVNRAAAVARGTTPPKSISQRRADRPRYQFKTEPPPLCDTPMCTATFTLTNAGELAGTGQVVVTADGLPVATHDFSLEPGKSVTYHEQTPNTHFNEPAGTRFTINWSARVVESK